MKIKDGTEIGIKDATGRMICCGDRVKYYEWREGYLVRALPDGWGRDTPLCRHDQYTEPAKGKTIEGVVKYSPYYLGFVVEFDDFMLASGRKSEQLFMLKPSRCEEKVRRLEVVG